nr:hypothetical protein CFP56_56537 [Quercus suber]
MFNYFPPLPRTNKERSLVKTPCYGVSPRSENITPGPAATQVIRRRCQPLLNCEKVVLRSQLGHSLSCSPHMHTPELRLRNNIRHQSGLRHSFIWTTDLNFEQQSRAVRHDCLCCEAVSQNRLAQECRNRRSHETVGMALPAYCLTNRPFQGRSYVTHDYPVRGMGGNWSCLYGTPVLNQKSIWSIGFEHSHRPRTMWPCAQELKYEGPDRISTDHIHRRFLPHPRICSSASGDWAQREFLPPLVFDEVGYPFRHFFDGLDMLRWNSFKRAEEEAFFAAHWISEVEFTQAINNDAPDEQGKHALGKALLDTLEC